MQLYVIVAYLLFLGARTQTGKIEIDVSNFPGAASSVAKLGRKMSDGLTRGHASEANGHLAKRSYLRLTHYLPTSMLLSS